MSRLLDLKAEESRVGRHVKPPLYGEAVDSIPLHLLRYPISNSKKSCVHVSVSFCLSSFHSDSDHYLRHAFFIFIGFFVLNEDIIS